MNSLIEADQHFIVLMMVFGAAALGIWSEHKRWFGKVSGILVTMISMSVLSMAGVVPVGSGTNVSVPVYDMVFEGQKRLVTPGILVGILGYVIGVSIALALA